VELFVLDAAQTANSYNRMTNSSTLAALAAIDSPDFRARAAALDARLAAGDDLSEESRAAALALPWPVYAVWQGCQLARASGESVRINDDDGRALAIIRWIAGGWELSAGDGRLIGVAPPDVFARFRRAARRL